MTVKIMPGTAAMRIGMTIFPKDKPIVMRAMAEAMGPETRIDHMRFLPTHKMKPTIRRNCIAMATFSKFCVPNTKPMALDKQPQMMYLRNPQAAQIATASGADN